MYVLFIACMVSSTGCMCDSCIITIQKQRSLKEKSNKLQYVLSGNYYNSLSTYLDKFKNNIGTYETMKLKRKMCY